MIPFARTGLPKISPSILIEADWTAINKVDTINVYVYINSLIVDTCSIIVKKDRIIFL